VADDSGIAPKVAHEFLGRYVGGASNLGYTHRDHKNYLRTKRQREMMYGEAGSLLKIFKINLWRILPFNMPLKWIVKNR
jgi:zinc finger SWIM domain-containing protein 3